MPIHYDTIEDGQNKTKQTKISSFILNLIYNCVIFFFILSTWFICPQYYGNILLTLFE